MGQTQTTGMSEVEPPSTYTRHTFSKGRLLAIARQLRKGRWLTESRPERLTYGQARYRAEALIKSLERQGVDVSRVEYRTWNDEGGAQWAIRERKE